MKKSIIIFLLAIAITGTTNAQKTSNRDCRTRMEANYVRGVYEVYITNLTNTPTSYQVNFPDGNMIKSTRYVLSGETLGTQQGASGFILGIIRVTPNQQVISNCPFGSVQVLLW